jgi:hypothetical protein
MLSQRQDQRPQGGMRKRQFDGPDRGVSKRPTGVPETVFRLLVQTKRVGSLIGKGGSIIKQMREETGARITIADAPQVRSELKDGSFSCDPFPALDKSSDSQCCLHGCQQESTYKMILP